MKALDFNNFDKLLEFRNYEPISQTLQEKWIIENCGEWLKSLNNPNSVSLWRGTKFTQKEIFLVNPRDVDQNRISKYSQTMSKIYQIMEDLEDFKYHESRLKSIFASISYKEADEHCSLGVKPVEMIIPDNAKLSSTLKDFNELEEVWDLRTLFYQLENVQHSFNDGGQDYAIKHIENKIKDQLHLISQKIETISAGEFYSKIDDPRMKTEYWTTSEVLLIPDSLRDRFRRYFKNFKDHI